MLFLLRLVIINSLILLIVVCFLIQNLPLPLSNKTLNNLKQMDVLGASTTSSNPKLAFELPKHNLPVDCWVEYSGHYYDITTVLDLDAGLANYCGQDATEAFDSKDPSQASIHSVEARRMFSQFLIQ